MTRCHPTSGPASRRAWARSPGSRSCRSPSCSVPSATKPVCTTPAGRSPRSPRSPSSSSPPRCPSSTALSAGVPLAPAFPAERFLPADDPEWPGHWADPPVPWDQAPGVELVSDESLADVRAALADLPSAHHDVIVLRDVQGRSPAEVRHALDLDAPAERELLNQARGEVRARLDHHFEERHGDG